MGPALNIISPCALSPRLSRSRQREERSRGAESLFPLSSPLSKTTGSGSGFLEMSAFVCCVTAAALGRSSSHEVMLELDEQAEWGRRGGVRREQPQDGSRFAKKRGETRAFSQQRPAAHGGHRTCSHLFSVGHYSQLWTGGCWSAPPLHSELSRWEICCTIWSFFSFLLKTHTHMI